MVAQDTLVTNAGITYPGQLIEIKGTHVYFLPEGSDSPQGIPSSEVSKIVMQNGSVLYMGGLNIAVSNKSTVPSEPTEENLPEENISLFSLGAGMVIASGIIGLLNYNRDFSGPMFDENMKPTDEYQRFQDSKDLFWNIHYLTLAIGGIMMAIGYNE